MQIVSGFTYKCLNSLHTISFKRLSYFLFLGLFANNSTAFTKEIISHKALLNCFEADNSLAFKCLSVNQLINKCSKKFPDLVFQYKLHANNQPQHMMLTFREQSTPFDINGKEIQGQIFLFSPCDTNESVTTSVSEIPESKSNQAYDPFTNVDRTEEIQKNSLKIDCLDALSEMKPLKKVSGVIKKLQSTCEKGETAASIEAIATAKLLSNNEFIFQGELTADRFLKENEHCIEINNVAEDNSPSEKKTVGCHSVFNSNIIDQNCVQAAMSNTYGNESVKHSVYSATNLFRQHIKENCYIENLNRGGSY